eukprot:15477772-Heterocapsa_arctica.AAC.1
MACIQEWLHYLIAQDKPGIHLEIDEVDIWRNKKNPARSGWPALLPVQCQGRPLRPGDRQPAVQHAQPP